MENRAFVFKARSHWIGLGYSPVGLRCLELSATGPEEIERKLSSYLGRGIVLQKPGRGSGLEELPSKLSSYFEGEKVLFDESVDLDGLTRFQKQVLDATREITYGEVRSYAWVASRIDNPRSFRAVGQALGRNPIPIVIPCHRVVTSQGTLGGFGLGIDTKRMLLTMEGSDKQLRGGIVS